MPEVQEGFVVATDAVVCDLIREARERLVVVAPALTPGMSEALLAAFHALDPWAVTIVLDSDPEVYRLGYGTLEAFDEVAAAAEKRGIAVRQQPGIRLGLVISDARTLIFTPAPALIEAGPNTLGQANAVCLGTPPRVLEADLGLGDQPARVGTRLMSGDDIDAVRRDLRANPPQKFDLARIVRTFNAYIEFVELEVKGTEVARHLVTIPSHLMAVVPARTRKNLKTSCRVVGEADAISGDKIAQERRLLTRRFLKVIPGFGMAIRRQDRDQFDDAVASLRASVEAFGRKVQDRLNEQIDRSIRELERSLLPALVKCPPEAWIPMSGVLPTRDTIRDLLNFELREAFGTAADMTRQMSVTCQFKGVTYEMLNNPAFMEKARAAFPDLPKLHEEKVAAVAERSLFDDIDTPLGR